MVRYFKASESALTRTNLSKGKFYKLASGRVSVLHGYYWEKSAIRASELRESIARGNMRELTTEERKKLLGDIAFDNDWLRRMRTGKNPRRKYRGRKHGKRKYVRKNSSRRAYHRRKKGRR